jgi:hypothetical protein
MKIGAFQATLGVSAPPPPATEDPKALFRSRDLASETPYAACWAGLGVCLSHACRWAVPLTASS